MSLVSSSDNNEAVILSSRRLLRLFHQINTHMTFLASHSRSTIPTYDLLNKLNSEITKLDLAIMRHILPDGDVTYEYVDENQVLLSLKEKVHFDWNTGYKQNENSTVDDAYENVANHNDRNNSPSKQLLIFDFKDVKTHGIGAIMKAPRKKQKLANTIDRNESFFLSCKELSVKNLSSKQLLSIILARDQKFQSRLDNFLADYSDEIEAMQALKAICEKKIPEPIVLNDPMDFLPSEKSLDNSYKPTVKEMMTALKSKSFYKDQIIHSSLLTKTTDAQFGGLNIHNSIKQEDEINCLEIHPDLKNALLDYKNISLEDGLYLHQVEAISSLLVPSTIKQHVIVSTSTSSGKSLIYQIPILNQILWDITNYNDHKRHSTAFFIFPTKALAQDQKRHLQDLVDHIAINCKRKIIIDTYDGDTPGKNRQYIRKYADIIFTNPDTIHASVLPNHNRVEDSGWIEFLSGLRYVVIDELHVYKGTFGVQVSYVMRRLNRLVHILQLEDMSQTPQPLRYISCSATILNPVDHFRVLCGISDSDNIVHVSKDGSPCGDKMFIMWSPPALMSKIGRTSTPSGNQDVTIKSQKQDNFIPRESIIPELAKILLHLLSNFPGIKVIVFCPIRKICELLMREIILLLPDHPSLSENDIMSYRGGYSKSDRRIIEQRMFNGQLRAIVATNALELGIDLSELDVVISCGYPMLKLNLHQQFGRAGRSANSNSLAIYVCGSTPIDQHFKAHPEELTDRDVYEDLCVAGMIERDSLKMLILEMQLQCAAFEYPIDMTRDIDWFVTNTRSTALCNSFVKACQTKLSKDGNGKYRTHHLFLPWPADHVSIRAVEETNYAVVDITNGKNIVIEEVEALRTSFTLYEGAIFLHQGLPYLVKEFNARDCFAKVERVKVEWITQQRDFTDVDPIEIEYIKCLQPEIKSHSLGSVPNADVPLFYGKIEIVTIVFGYFKVNRRLEILEAVEVDNPPMKIQSKGFWLDIPRKALDLIREKNLNPAGGIHAAQHAIMNILPLFISGGATTNPNVRFNSSIGEAELRTECKAPLKEFAQRNTSRKRPARLIFYDAKGGSTGTGVSAKTFEHFDEILNTTYCRIRDCDCEWGCPMCVHGSFCKEMLLVISKPAAEIILGTLMGVSLENLREKVNDGPEPNLPNINIETIDDSRKFVKMAPDVEILEVVHKPKAEKFEIKMETSEEKIDSLD